MAKSMTAMSGMPEGPGSDGLEQGSGHGKHGDEQGRACACKHYRNAQKMSAAK